MGKFWKQQFIPVLIVAQILGIALSALISLLGAVEEQSVEHQKSLSPLSEFILLEFIHPLYLLQGIVDSSNLTTLISQGDIDEQKISAELKRLQSKYDYNFFVASEKTLMQYNADGSSIDLTPGKIVWYFRNKDSSKPVIAAIGNRENPHIYFDFKIRDNNGEFVGFVGIGKPLKGFLDAFESQRETFHYDLYFVDNQDNILFASDYSKVPDGKRILKLNDVDWFKSINNEQLVQDTLNNQVIEHDGTKLLIAEIDIAPIDWRIILVNPLQVRQSRLFNNFFMQTIYVVMGILLFIWAFAFVHFTIRQLQLGRVQKDALTQLPTRQYIHNQFAKLHKKAKPMSLLVMDVDHFKSVNDHYGHSVGDQVLVSVAQAISQELRDDDIAVRWGGEEFVVLLPGCKLLEADTIARRIQNGVANTSIFVEDELLSVTISIGVSYHDNADELKELFEPADQALYCAKNNGRNRVELSAG